MLFYVMQCMNTCKILVVVDITFCRKMVLLLLLLLWLQFHIIIIEMKILRRKICSTTVFSIVICIYAYANRPIKATRPKIYFDV